MNKLELLNLVLNLLFITYIAVKEFHNVKKLLNKRNKKARKRKVNKKNKTKKRKNKRIFKFLFIIKGGDAHNNLVALLLFVVALFLICKDTLFISICYIVYAIRRASAR